MTSQAFRLLIQKEIAATKVAMHRAKISERDFLIGKLTALLVVDMPNIGNAAALSWAQDTWLRLRTTTR